jgi:hypothetical protein
VAPVFWLIAHFVGGGRVLFAIWVLLIAWSIRLSWRLERRRKGEDGTIADVAPRGQLFPTPESSDLSNSDAAEKDKGHKADLPLMATPKAKWRHALYYTGCGIITISNLLLAAAAFHGSPF